MTDAPWPFDRCLDLRGLACPLPVLKARKALLAMTPGQTLAVEASDPLAAIDIPNFCREAGHALLAEARRDDSWLFLIACGEAAAPGAANGDRS
ncbi:MAG: sulfurtransferase TusA family protein [Bauldia sp.]|nr:sulfurtransferase TusA family protein [Bauldia sp.]